MDLSGIVAEGRAPEHLLRDWLSGLFAAKRHKVGDPTVHHRHGVDRRDQRGRRLPHRRPHRPAHPHRPGRRHPGHLHRPRPQTRAVFDATNASTTPATPATGNSRASTESSRRLWIWWYGGCGPDGPGFHRTIRRPSTPGPSRLPRCAGRPGRCATTGLESWASSKSTKSALRFGSAKAHALR